MSSGCRATGSGRPPWLAMAHSSAHVSRSRPVLHVSVRLPVALAVSCVLRAAGAREQMPSSRVEPRRAERRKWSSASLIVGPLGCLWRSHSRHSFMATPAYIAAGPRAACSCFLAPIVLTIASSLGSPRDHLALDAATRAARPTRATRQRLLGTSRSRPTDRYRARGPHLPFAGAMR